MVLTYDKNGQENSVKGYMVDGNNRQEKEGQSYEKVDYLFWIA